MKRGVFRGSPLYEEIAGIPFLAYVPGVKPRRTDAIIAVPDFMPTFLELAGVQTPKTVQGKSFLPVIKGETDGHRDFTVTTQQLQNPGEITRAVDDTERKVELHLTATLTTDEWTMLYAWEGAKAELYNRKSDPKQENNVIDENPLVAQDLHGRYYELLKEIGTEERLLAPRTRL